MQDRTDRLFEFSSILAGISFTVMFFMYNRFDSGLGAWAAGSAAVATALFLVMAETSLLHEIEQEYASMERIHDRIGGTVTDIRFPWVLGLAGLFVSAFILMVLGPASVSGGDAAP